MTNRGKEAKFVKQESVVDSVSDYLKQPYARVILPESDGSYRGEILEFPGCVAVGDTAAEALTNLEGAALGWLEAALEKGQPIPAPVEQSNDFSGRLALRLPKNLHKKAAWFAEREGSSLNQFIVASLSEAIGEKKSSRSQVVNFTTVNQNSHFLIVPQYSRLSGEINSPAKFVHIEPLKSEFHSITSAVR